VAMGPHEGESTVFPRMVEALHKAYGRSDMIDIIDADAGLTSLANADLVDKLGYGYVFAIKGNQPELFAEARALLEPMTASQPPEAESAWEGRNGKQIRRRLWRTPEMRGFENSVGTWSHLRQTWLVRQETRNKEGSVEIEDRFFVTSLLWNYFKSIQILLLVRGHWGIENDSNNSLDLQWLEDSGPWCTQGNAVWALGLLRLMAYNIVQYLRKRRLRRNDKIGAWMSPMRWRTVFKLIRQALENAAPVSLQVFPGV
ncbi:MAG: ISAs1 family transposase, partial [Deltaproteobacteria bacterium]|nr:ISAs1 family transposase [Deltaproteobacteria bacterium]